MGQIIANISYGKCLNRSCNSLPKIVYEFYQGSKKILVFVCGSHRREAQNYGLENCRGWDLNIRNWPKWLKHEQEKELAQIKKESESGGKGKEN